MDSFESRMNPRFLAESEKGMLQEPRVIESGREMIEDFKEDEKGKRRAFVLSLFSLSWFSVIHVFMSSAHAFSSLVGLVTLLREADFWRCEPSAKSWWFTEWLAIISERGVMYRMKRMGSSTEPWVHELWWWQRWVIYWSGLIPVWEIWLKPLECSKLMPKTGVQAGEEILVVSSVKQKNRNVIVQSRENIIYNMWQNGLNAVSCSIGLLTEVAEVVFLEMGETFVENDFFKHFGQEWKVRRYVVFWSCFLWFQNESYSQT